MNDDEAAFVEQLGQHLYGRGMQRMAGRMWAYLLICEPADQTADQLVEALHASRGAISGAARDLANAGVIRRGRRRGERREYFSVPAGSIRRLVGDTGRVLASGREIADEGLALLAGQPPAVRERLQEFRDIYAYYEREWPRVVERYLEDRNGPDRPVANSADRAIPPPAVGAIERAGASTNATGRATGAPGRNQTA